MARAEYAKCAELPREIELRVFCTICAGGSTIISALERLRALREGRSLNDLDVTGPESLPMDWRIEFEKQVAILYATDMLRDWLRREAQTKPLLADSARSKK